MNTGKHGSYWLALDGLRGIAVLLVVAGHMGALPWTTGALGVTVFFAISGFLITGVLMGREHSLWAFYGARAARLLPAIAVLVVMVGLVWVAQGRSLSRIAEEATTALFYVENFFHGRHDGGVLGHTWSLAVEEQFYLVWPFALALLLKFSARARLVSIGAVILASVLLRFGLGSRGAADFAYASLPTNAYALLLGCALALAPRPTRGRALILGGASVLALATVAAPHVPSGVLTVTPLAALGGTMLVAGALHGNALLEKPALRFVGRVSYAWYLWHWPALWFTGTVEDGWEALLPVAVSFVLAVVSTLCVEEPIRRWWRERQSVNQLAPSVK